AAQEIKSIIDRSQLKDAAHALQLGRFELAVENYDKWLTAHTPAGAAMDAPEVAAVRVGLLKALIGLKDGGRARQEAAALLKHAGAEKKAELEKLAAEAQMLPEKTEQALELLKANQR
ncbi:MAG TPA: hypothetical protein VEK08_09070, partial [Planctomycetota bacterium]|nr:hypothetical protein [Planctomycetota bacterium]